MNQYSEFILNLIQFEINNTENATEKKIGYCIFIFIKCFVSQLDEKKKICKIEKKRERAQ